MFLSPTSATAQYAAGTGVEGPLTGRGRELLSQLAQVGMTLDVSHLAEESFYGALDHFPGPVIASHNNCRALVPGDRQLSDEQIRLLLDRSASSAWFWMPGCWFPVGFTGNLLRRI